MGDTLLLPLIPCAPLQAPLAVHAVALVLVQAKVELLPTLIIEGVAVSVTVGTGGGLTVTVVVPAAVPSVPVQVSV